MEAESNTNTSQKKRVLIVEDDLELVRIYENLLGGFQYEVRTATDGTIALRSILAGDVDAILCDLKMPELDGDLFYGAVERAKPYLCNRFIFISGAVDDPKYRAFLSQTKSPVLRKPLHPATLLQELRRLLGSQDAGRM